MGNFTAKARRTRRRKRKRKREEDGTDLWMGEKEGGKGENEYG
jgi:hypothetical protein